MTVLWTAADAVAATGGKTTTEWAALGVSIDTRSLQPGDLFVALTDLRDGHDFVALALEKGAAAALVSHVPQGVSDTAPLLVVPDVLAGLEDLGRAARARTKAQVIAVTGSVGKTSTKEMLRRALVGQGHLHAAEMSFNNHWGVPLTLARMPQNSDFAVIEIGMNHAGEITPLSKMTRPHVALVTTVAAAHMAAFQSIDHIALAKAEIFDGMAAGGTAVLNRDIETFEILLRAAHKRGLSVVTFGQDAQADYHLHQTLPTAEAVTVKAQINGAPILFKLTTSGTHQAMNALAVLAAVAAVDGDLTIAALDLAAWHPPAGRGLRHWILLDVVQDEQRLMLIDDAYNANPTSMAAAFDVLAATEPVDDLGRIKKGRKIAFLTDMLELGEDAAKDHKELARLPAIKSVDIIHCAGPLMKKFYKKLPADQQGEWHKTAETLAPRVNSLLDAGDVVMVKGSKGSKASVIVDAITKLGQVALEKRRGTL